MRNTISSTTMKKSGSVKASPALRGKPEASVLDMEDRLNALKQQMALERAKREELLQRSGTGSFWLNGRQGALRGPQVKDFVRTGAKEARMKKAAQKKNSEVEEDRTSPMSGASTERSGSFGDNLTGSTSPKQADHGGSQDIASYPCEFGTQRPIQTMNAPQRPATPLSHQGISGACPQRPMTASTVDDGGCQTERPARKEWVITSTSRPRSARPATYFDKIMAARRGAQLQGGA